MIFFRKTPNFYKLYFEGHEQEFPQHRLWVRNVLTEPSQAPCTGWTFWQYADHARVKGIPGPTDMNAFCGTAEEFAQMTSSRSRPN